MSDAVLIYATVPDEATGRAIADAVLDARLAACVNILGPMESHYHWQGARETGTERPVLIKTQARLADAAIAAARRVHPYGEPCFLVLPVTGGAAGFLAWIAAETAAR